MNLTEKMSLTSGDLIILHPELNSPTSVGLVVRRAEGHCLVLWTTNGGLWRNFVSDVWFTAAKQNYDVVPGDACAA